MKAFFSPSSFSNESKEISTRGAESDLSASYSLSASSYIYITYTEGRKRRWKFLRGGSSQGRSLNLDYVR